MPNIRIKDIPTTASVSSSTDFLALDGSANGTRKLNAFSPTFGGNLTASGTGSHVFGTTNTVTLAGGTMTATKGIVVSGDPGSGLTAEFSGATGVNMRFNKTDATAQSWQLFATGNVFGVEDVTGGFVPFQVAKTTGNATLSGNLTVSGTGTSSVAGNWFVGTTTAAASGARIQAQLTGTDGTVSTLLSLRKNTNAVGTGVAIDFIPESTDVPLAKLSAVRTNVNNGYTDFRFSTWNGSALVEQLRLVGETGNFIIGSSFTDGGQKLQVSGTAAATSFVVANSAGGGVIIGNSTGDYGSVGYNIAPTGTGGVYNYRVTDYASRIEFLQGGFKFKNAASGTAGNAITFTDALTIDSSQNATFAGTVKIANTAAINGVYTTTTTFDFGTIANNDASSVCTLTMTGVSSSDSIIVSPTDGDNFPQFCTVSAVPSGNSVSVRLYNGSGSSRTVGSRTIRVTAIKF